MKAKLFGIGLMVGALALAIVAFNIDMADAAAPLWGIGGSGLLLFGMATARNSTWYTQNITNAYLQEGTGAVNIPSDGRRGIIPIDVTIVSVSAVNDTYNVGVIKANSVVTGVRLITTGQIGASAAATAVQLGTSTTADLFMKATNMGLVENTGTLGSAAMGLILTADTTVVLKISTGTPTVGGRIKGFLEYIPLN